MRIALCLYSATGNTRKLAEACAHTLEAAGHRVDRFDLLETLGSQPPLPAEYDWFGVATPVMLFRPPQLVREFIARLEPAPERKRAFLLLTSSGWPASTVHTLKNQLATRNLGLTRFCAVTCADSYIPFRKWFGTRWNKGKPDEASSAKVREFARELVAAPNAGGGDRIPYRPWSPLHWAAQGTPVDGAKLFLGPRELVAEDCTRCGVCAQVCPTRAITLDDLPTCDEATCVGCCACFNNCPTQAWRLRRFAPRYFYRYGVG